MDARTVGAAGPPDFPDGRRWCPAGHAQARRRAGGAGVPGGPGPHPGPRSRSSRRCRRRSGSSTSALRALRPAFPHLVRYLRDERPVAMLSALDYVNIVALWSRRLAGGRTRLVVSERNHLSTAHRHRTTRRDKLVPGLLRRFYPWADAIVAVSKSVADDLTARTGLSRDRIEVIYNPVVTPEVVRMVQEPLDHPVAPARSTPGGGRGRRAQTPEGLRDLGRRLRPPATPDGRLGC